MFQYIDATDTEPRYCEFSYDLAELVNRLQMESSYMAITIKTNEGVPLVDDYAITDDENDIAMQFLSDGAREIANREFSKLARVPYEQTSTSLLLRAESVPEAEGREQKVDDDIIAFVTASAMLKWCELKNLSNQAQIYMSRRMESMQSLHKSLFEFRL